MEGVTWGGLESFSHSLIKKLNENVTPWFSDQERDVARLLLTM